VSGWDEEEGGGLRSRGEGDDDGLLWLATYERLSVL